MTVKNKQFIDRLPPVHRFILDKGTGIMKGYKKAVFHLFLDTKKKALTVK